MIVTNKLQPEPEQFEHLLSIDGPICLVNLLKFREKAEYPDGRDAELSGMEAFMRYALPMGELIAATGGRFRFTGAVEGLLIGDAEESWDLVGIAEYPSAQALADISANEKFLEIEEHRLAGLKGQLNIITREAAG